MIVVATFVISVLLINEDNICVFLLERKMERKILSTKDLIMDVHEFYFLL